MHSWGADNNTVRWLLLTSSMCHCGSCGSVITVPGFLLLLLNLFPWSFLPFSFIDQHAMYVSIVRALHDLSTTMYLRYTCPCIIFFHRTEWERNMGPETLGRPHVESMSVLSTLYSCTYSVIVNYKHWCSFTVWFVIASVCISVIGWCEQWGLVDGSGNGNGRKGPGGWEIYKLSWGKGEVTTCIMQLTHVYGYLFDDMLGWHLCNFVQFVEVVLWVYIAIFTYMCIYIY